jgi:lysophospholipase L1-like esterase
MAESGLKSTATTFARRSVLAGLVLAPLASSLRAQTMTWKYDFTAAPKAGFQTAPATNQYSAEAGYGFEPSGLFSVKVPEGNYRVTVELGGAAASDTTVKAESRRLMLESVRVPAGRTETRSFIVNVRNASMTPPPVNAPGFDSVATNDREVGSYTWDDKLTLEFVGPAPAVARIEIEPVDVPTVYIAGDSTVTDQRSEPGASWGQMLPRFFKPDIAIANHAESGETLKSFITGRRMDKMLSKMKAGDFLMIQFAHNDSKASWPQTYAPADSTYRDYLKVFIGEARRRGATPILLTPPNRRSFGPDGKNRNTHGGYPDAVRAVGKETGVPVIDLFDMSNAFYEALGPELAPKAFSGVNGSDATHHDNYGAYELARAISEGIRKSVPTLAAHLDPSINGFDPAHPTPPSQFILAPSHARSSERPRGS